MWLAHLGATRAEQVANGLFLVGCGLDVGNPALVVAGILDPVELPGEAVIQPAAGLVLLGSIPLAVAAQHAMAGAWRTGIDPDHPGPLITGGVFRVVRNPTYTSLVTCSIALALLAPTGLAVVAVAVCAVGLQIQTRLVEEPHLSQVHGRAYDAYAARVGRFVPSLGRVRA